MLKRPRVSLGHPMYVYQAVTTTQAVARDLASRGAPEGTLVVAEVQTAGRGRRGRGWVSPGGGLWLSLILRPSLPAAQAPRLTLAAGVAAVRAVTGLTGLTPGIKWPNDLLIAGRKVCGILAEAMDQRGGGACVILGVGINVNVREEQFPPELRESATSLSRELGRDVSQPALCQHFLNTLEIEYTRCLEGGFDLILDLWRRFSVTLGQQVAVTLPEETLTGHALDIAPDGGLVLALPGGGQRHISAGEVTLRPLFGRELESFYP